MPKLSPARAAVFEILMHVEQGAHADELLHSARLHELASADRALCTEIVMGVLRWRSRLDRTIARFSFTPLHNLDRQVLTALRIGVYQISFLDRIPHRAAINESVELVKHAGKSSAASLANAVLRKSAAEVATHGKTQLIDRDQIDFKSATADRLAAEFAHPLWLVKRWCSEFGMEVAGKIARCNQEVPTAHVRITRHAARLEEEFRAHHIELEAGKLLTSARRVISGDITQTRAFRERRIGVQDEGSQLVALLVGTGGRLLDCCAAPGGKTAVLCERNPQATIVAAELHSRRAQLTRRLLLASNVRVITADATALPLACDFDRVLADVPCSGTGTLARNPDIKWRLNAENLATKFHLQQVAILRGALDHLAPGGRLVYSTCSLEREENEAVVEEVTHGRGDLAVIDVREELRRLQVANELVWSDVELLASGPYLRTIPGVHPCDGFFAAIIQKSQGSKPMLAISATDANSANGRDFADVNG